ncbi:MAG: trypsin-like peptidase domain-containing protein [Actinomycetota bacterium]
MYAPPTLNANPEVPTAPTPPERPPGLTPSGFTLPQSTPSPAAPPQLPPSQPSPTPASSSSSKGSKALVAALAFVLGGAVGAGGFALGASSNDTGQTDAGSPLTPISSPAELPATEAPPIAPPVEGSVEPAAAVAARLGPSVVQVETGQGQGSGVAYAEGLILTNHHVVAGANQVQIRTSDGEVFDAEVLGSDERIDIAVLSVPGSDIPVAAIGSSAALQPGQLTVAIGSPFQLQQTVTAGIVSSLNRPVPNPDGSVTAMIQTDAPINPGNSGGALGNINGELVGINTSIRTDGTSNTNVGIGFAVPIDTAITVAKRIVAGESLEPAVLGVSGDVTDGQLGVPIAEVTVGSGADGAGLLAGDRVLSIDGVPVTTIGELAGLVQTHFSGDSVELVVQRGSETITLTAVLQ